jgi:Bacterial membrane protein YfhO
MNIVEKKGMRSALIFYFFAVALTLDLYSNHRNLNPVCDSEFYQYHHPALQPLIDDPGLFRVFADKMPTPHNIGNSINNHHIKWQMMLLPNLGILDNLYHVGGVPALELRYQHQITEILTKPWKERIHFLKLANVKYIISQDRLDREPDLVGKVEKVNGLVYRIRDFLPRAWIVGEIKKIEQGTVNELTNGLFNPSTTALGQRNFEVQYDAPFFRNIDKMVYQKNGEIHIEVQTENPGILMVSESSYPGWKVYEDGREKEMLWLDLLFQGVKIGPGKHDIMFKFRPKHFSLFLFISLASLALLFSVWALFWIKGRFKPSSFQQSRL